MIRPLLWIMNVELWHVASVPKSVAMKSFFRTGSPFVARHHVEIISSRIVPVEHEPQVLVLVEVGFDYHRHDSGVMVELLLL